MESITHQLQCSCATFPSRPLSRTKGIKLRHHIETLHMIGRTDRSSLLKHNCLSVGTPRFRGLKGKGSKFVAFKGSVQNDESGGRTSGSKSTKNPIKLSIVTRGSEEAKLDSPKAQSVSLPHPSEASETIEGSAAVHNLFKKWLVMLRTQSPGQDTDVILGEGTPPKEISDTQNGTHKKEGGIQKAIWSYFHGLDAAIKIPLLVSIPCFLVVNLVYGAEVSKELTPLWVLGPLIVALYVKMFRGIIALYVFNFKQTVKIMKNLPTYFAHGKLKDDILARFWQPLGDMRNLDYKEASKRKMKELGAWMMEKYLDFVELIWPFYCRTIRFLKRANLV